jgi:ubiquinone/menaquinone biosynthesis C-methylase UbiE
LGIDTDTEAIESLKNQWPNFLEDGPFVFLEGDINNFPLQEKEFDIAVFSHSF